jgi:hypothetical protein
MEPDDVATFEEFEVRVTDANDMGSHEDVVGSDRRDIDLADGGLIRSGEDQRFHCVLVLPRVMTLP